MRRRPGASGGDRQMADRRRVAVDDEGCRVVALPPDRKPGVAAVMSRNRKARRTGPFDGSLDQPL